MAVVEPPEPTSVEDVLARSGPTFRGWLTAGALLALAAVTVLAVGLVWREYEDAKREATEELESRATLAATVFDTYFAGQLDTLSAIASSPSVTSRDVKSMTRYFASFRPGKGGTFDAGVGWIDLDGRQRATSDPAGPTALSLADRTYFTSVVATRKPFVSEVIVGRTSQRRVVVMSVPTRDARGRMTGVLAGGLVLPPSRQDAGATDLGYAGLHVIDRAGQQITRRDLARPENAELVTRLRTGEEGLLADTRGLDGSPDHVVAYATSPVPAWTVVLDQPASTVYAAALRDLRIELALVAAAVALILALMVWAVHRARRDLRRQRARVSGWAELTRALNAATSVKGLRESLASSLATEFPDSSAVVVIEEDGTAQATVTRGARSSLRLDERAANATAQLVADSGAELVLDRQSQVQSRAYDTSAFRDVRSAFGVPLLDESGTGGAVALVFARERGLDRTDLTLLHAHADQAAQALARVRRHQQEHDVAALLQESLLPDELPSVDGVKLAAYYRAGVAGTNAGGDWYDVVRRPDGITHFSVGDVAGRGIRAAVSMGQLRNAFQAYALEHASPAAVIQRMARHVEQDGMATMTCITFDSLTYEIAYSSAGHVPPLLLDSAEQTITRLTASVGSPPLGWFAQGPPVDDTTSVAPGMTLALYSDGLVERRGVSIDDSIDGIGAAILASAAASPEAVVRTALGELADAQLGDDVALLVLQFQASPQTVQIEISADPSLLRDMRRRLGRWLTLRGLDERKRSDAILAISEACNNAIEHGYRDRLGTIGIRLDHRDGWLQIRVADTGGWREPQADPTRGRGLLIMRSLMDDSDVVPSPTGTEVVLGQRL